jgi:replicative DNA helicase
VAFSAQADLHRDQDDEAECALLAAILAGADIPDLEPEHFYREEHRLIFSVCRELSNEGSPVTERTLIWRLRDSNRLEAAGGVSYITALAEPLAAVANVDYFEREVLKGAARREMVSIGRELQNSGGRSLHEVIRLATAKLGSIEDRLSDGAQGTGFGFVATHVEDLITMDLPDRERLLGAWLHYQDLAMAHAWRGVGKTYFALGVAVAVAAGKPYLTWEAGHRPAGVLYVDGEMPAKAMQDRLEILVRAIGLPRAPLQIVTPDLQPDGMRSLNKSISQRAVEEILNSNDDIKLVIFDNLSALCDGPENDAESWQAMQEFILRLRRRGVAVLIIHHSGKGGLQRGTSRREDVLDVVVHLTHPPGYESTEGVRFQVRFEKSRGVFGDAVKPFEASLTEDEDGTLTWAVKSLDDSRAEQVARMRRKGMSQTEISDELGIHKSNVSRAVKRARKQGLLDDDDEDIN